MIIMPNNYDPTKWQSSLHRHRAVRARLVHPEGGRHASPATSRTGAPRRCRRRPSSRSTTTQAASILALTGGTIDVLGQFSVTGGQALLNGSYNVIKLKASTHRQLSMRTDQAPFTDPRVRQAIALTLNRPQIITALFKGVRRHRQRQPVLVGLRLHRHQHRPARAERQQGQVAAGGGRARDRGLPPSSSPSRSARCPTYAQIVAQSAAAIGVKINLKVEPSSAYYGKATFGNSDWLDATMSLVDYGHRSVPNLFLGAPLQTINATTGTGSWNAAHFSNAQYDKLVSAVRRGRSTCPPRRASPGRSRRCCSTRRRSSSRTSTTT